MQVLTISFTRLHPIHSLPFFAISRFTDIETTTVTPQLQHSPISSMSSYELPIKFQCFEMKSHPIIPKGVTYRISISSTWST